MKRTAHVRRLAALVLTVALLATACSRPAIAPTGNDAGRQQPSQTGIMLAGDTSLRQWPITA